MRNVDWENAVKFFAPIGKSERIHPNFIFRFQHLGLSEHHAASCVGVDLDQVHRWDDGEDIPPLVRKVWTLESGKYLPAITGFSNWSFKSGHIVTPDGASYTEGQLRHALFLLDQIT
ncbi:hypothetical protein AB6H46_23005 [Vibrio alginolyticus]|uniref:hypothetical protein n=1 Tax=Vibrio harveyi group TaxID=717610 RepID=UPI001120953F|nr:hypothetical protein [Vibrio parahaemolyticus]MCR9788863.1 hypothetical protein [Vibrio parahaemolyticus]MCR9827153.1 hypothetical protein [Vibrio parahaemolyticus]TOH01202.1 hypothetical protein CGI90_25460 [Vibrio parahaemolyticus]HCG9432694.1 hypothetical protein [Vibrio parahaemolyticus]HCH3558394.1 hypothetical protein [Vibrio parahaemolyticus]